MPRQHQQKSFLVAFARQTKVSKLELENSKKLAISVFTQLKLVSSSSQFVSSSSRRKEERGRCETRLHNLKLQQTFTHPMRLCQLKTVGEKVGKNRNKFCLSPTLTKVFANY